MNCVAMHRTFLPRLCTRFDAIDRAPDRERRAMFAGASSIAPCAVEDCRHDIDGELRQHHKWNSETEGINFGERSCHAVGCMTRITLDAAIWAMGGQITQVASLKRPRARCAAGRPAQSPMVHQYEIHGRPQVVFATRFIVRYVLGLQRSRCCRTVSFPPG